ncbi:antitoxin of toxin-antitoxin stability system [Actimicrobium sp. CCI2.3]|uniref:antitoxin of toxin-antitoxin stability system n=1 Tax=Actimicrobium sp. CCI2.3 TaxID=3048616 RepID=UPI002AB4763B|nr:antitoxin of toxin-antitoxin stability system [Actimicrobium sp. CCI2.3]MDY7575704.1 antitoxin of toxin-antitoxin stability system [Actimicrobium sp. CCI2.3]MEB0021925.1 antitoxin of toxin-antitoxin stability system [Actimicrobium sp. CCI2.3]
MSKEAVFTMKLEAELRAAFMAEAQASHRPASQIVRDMMRGFVQNQREARDYNEFLRDKVATARLSVQAGSGNTNEIVEARFAARRAELTRENEE